MANRCSQHACLSSLFYTQFDWNPSEYECTICKRSEDCVCVHKYMYVWVSHTYWTLDNKRTKKTETDRQTEYNRANMCEWQRRESTINTFILMVWSQWNGQEEKRKNKKMKVIRCICMYGFWRFMYVGYLILVMEVHRILLSHQCTLIG